MSFTIYQSLQNRPFILKKDMFNCLQSHVETQCRDHKTDLVKDSVTWYLNQVKALENPDDLMRYPENLDLQSAYDEKMTDLQDRSRLDIANLMKGLKGSFRSTSEKDSDVIAQIIFKSLNTLSFTGNEESYVEMMISYRALRIQMQSFYSEYISSMATDTPVIRVYQKENRYTVEVDEVLRVLKEHEMDVRGIDKLPKSAILEIKELAKKIDEKVFKTIEFVAIQEEQLEIKNSEESSDLKTDSEPEVSSKSSMKKKKSKKEVSKKREEESNSCPKCFRSSEFSRNTNEKLRLSKVENRALKKELAQCQMENEEQKEMIRQLKQKLEEQEKKLQETTEEKEKIKEELDEKKTKKSPEYSEEYKDNLFQLLNIRNTLQLENPIEKAEEIVNQLSEGSEEIQIEAAKEIQIFHTRCHVFMDTVSSNITQLLSNPSSTLLLPEFPSFSKQFHISFKKTLNSECPSICQSLLLTPPPSSEEEEEECVICLDEMKKEEEEKETIECGNCTKKYHKKCAVEWFKINRNCPICRIGMLDHEEFPVLC